MITHAAALFTMLVVIQTPPDYYDEDKTNSAKWIFIALAVLHALCIIGKGIELYRIINGKTYSKSI